MRLPAATLKKSTLLRAAVLVLLVAGGLVVWYRMPAAKALLQTLPHKADRLGLWGPVLLAAIYVPGSLFLVPGSVITLVGAFALGMTKAFVAVSVGSTLGACASFLVSRYLLRDWLQRRLRHNVKFQAIDRAVAEQGFRIVLLVRLSPALPFGPLNYAFGLTRISLARFALGSWLGMLPGTVMYVYLGAAAQELADITSGRVVAGRWQQAAFLAGLVATIVVTLFITRLATRAVRQSVDEPRPESQLPR